MATVGSSTGTPSAGWNQTSSYNEVAGDTYTMPETGLITDMSGYFAGNGGSFNAKLCVWDGATGDLLASTASTSIPSGGTGAGNQAWHTIALTSSLLVLSGATLRFGWWEDDTRAQNFSVFGSGQWHGKQNVPTGPGSFATYNTPGSPFFQGGLGAYATYTPVKMYVDDGVAWQPISAIYADDGAAWQSLTAIYVDDGAAWQQIG